MAHEPNDDVKLPDAPDIPGLTFRRFRGEADFALTAAIEVSCNRADGIDWFVTARDLASEFARMPESDPRRDVLIAEIAGEAIGFVRLAWWREYEGDRIYATDGHVLPAWRRRGIGTVLLRASERRAREVAAGHPPNDARFLEAMWSDSEPSRRSLLEAEGYEPTTRSARMVRPNLEDIPAAPLPPGLEVRPVRPEHYRAIWDADVEAFQDHLGASVPSEADYEQFLAQRNFDPALWKIAWDGGQVVGQVRSFIDSQENAAFDRERGYTEEISVRRPWRRRGLARALLVQSLHELKRRGMSEAALGVQMDGKHDALRLYQSVGFQVMRVGTAARKRMD